MPNNRVEATRRAERLTRNVITQEAIMKNNLLFKLWMVLLIGFLIGLSTWAIFLIDKTEHQIGPDNTWFVLNLLGNGDTSLAKIAGLR